MNAIYHITFIASDGRLIEAECEAAFTPGEGFDEFAFEDVVITNPHTKQSELHDFMPEEYVSEAEYAAEGQMPTK